MRARLSRSACRRRQTRGELEPVHSPMHSPHSMRPITAVGGEHSHIWAALSAVTCRHLPSHIKTHTQAHTASADTVESRDRTLWVHSLCHLHLLVLLLQTVAATALAV